MMQYYRKYMQATQKNISWLNVAHKLKTPSLTVFEKWIWQVVFNFISTVLGDPKD
jgi:hypothetical protein